MTTNFFSSFLSKYSVATKKVGVLLRKNAENRLLQNCAKERNDLFLEMKYKVKDEMRVPVYRYKSRFFVINRSKIP
jgi:hypothetical protein